jgi:hypothetical protein
MPLPYVTLVKDPHDYFPNREILYKKRQDALRAFFSEKRAAEEVAGQSYKTITVEAGGLKKAALEVPDERITVRGYRDAKTGAVKPIARKLSLEADTANFQKHFNRRCEHRIAFKPLVGSIGNQYFTKFATSDILYIQEVKGQVQV